MPDGLRAGALGLATALGIGLPAALLGQILEAALDHDLPDLLTVTLALVVLVGAAAGGWVVARQPGGGRLGAPVVGAVAIGAVSTLGAVRRDVAGETAASPAALGALVVTGAVVAYLGAVAGTRRAARTRG